MSSGNTTPQNPASLQSELLARSGFQPYRPDERHLHPAGQFPIESFSPFGPIPGMPPSSEFEKTCFNFKTAKIFIFIFTPGGLFNPSALSYHEALYMLRSNPHAALYSQLASPYPPHLYGLLPGSPANLPAIHERMKLEEEHRARIAREEEKAREEREREMREREQREKEMREREQREKEQREREKREKEMREREMREKEMREREMREKEQREREMREREQREREKMIQQHHFMQSQRNPYGLLGLFPPMVGLRPSQMHPAYTSMHPSLLGLPPLPTTLASSLPIPPHHSQQSPQNIPPSAVPTSSPGLSVMSPLGLTSSPHGLPHSLPLFPPPAHLYSPHLAPPTASPSSLSNSSYSHPMLTNPVSSPQPTRPPSNNPTSAGITSREQSLNLSKNSINMSSTTPPLSQQQQQQYSRRNEVETKPLHSASSILTTTTSQTSSVSTNNLTNEQKPKPTDLTQQQQQQQNGNNVVNSLSNAGISVKGEEQQTTIKDEKSSPDSLKASVLMEKPLIDMNIKVEGDEKKEEKMKVESLPSSPKNIMEMNIDVKKDIDNSVINNKTGESESIVTRMEVDEKKSDEKMINDDATTIAEKDVVGTNINNNETNKTSSKKA